MARFRKLGVLEVRGLELQWHVRHFGGLSHMYDTPRGLSVGVCVEPGRSRELVIEFAYADYFFDAPSQQSEFEKRLCILIEEAIVAGWVPDSRGRAFVFAAPKLGVAAEGRQE
jgi:hypothetical protein